MTAQKKPTSMLHMLRNVRKLYYLQSGLALVYTVTLLAQLFTFEKFPLVIYGLGLPGGEIVAKIIAISVVILGIAALPYLLRLDTHRRIVWYSRIAVIKFPLAWLLLTSWALGTGEGQNSGVLGATIPIPATISVIVVELIVAIWALLAVYGTRLHLERSRSR